MMPWSSPGIKPVGSCVLTTVDAGGKAPDDGHGQRAARDDPPQDPGITARDLLDAAVKRTLHKGHKNEQEADRPPQIIRQISYAPRPATRQEHTAA